MPTRSCVGILSGAGNEARTRYLHLGKVALYQMSYARGTRGILPEKHPLVKTLLQDFPNLTILELTPLLFGSQRIQMRPNAMCI